MPAHEQPDHALRVLLADSDELRPVLPEGLPGDSVLLAAQSEQDTGRAAVPFLDRPDADPNDLRAQRWGIIAPEGSDGDALLEAIAPLRALREQEQGALATVFRLPCHMDAAAALAWRDKTYRRIPARERPRFLLLLGELTQLSIELQHVLAHSAFAGRLAFSDGAGRPDLAAYAAYAHKAQAASQAGARAGSPEVLLYAAPDGTPATMAGNHLLVTPCHAALGAAGWRTERFGRDGKAAGGSQAFLDAARTVRDGVLLSLTHGLGRRRRGWTAEEQRARQGALVLDAQTTLESEQVRKGSFLPGGVWLSVACYGAATPPRSAFYPWLKLLAQHGAYRSAPQQVLANLPRPEQGEEPFVAALPQAALANPEGPLAFLGHSDLAWIYAFTAPDERHRECSSRFTEVLESLARGSRAGVALDCLMGYYREVNDSLRADNQARQDAIAYEQPDPVDPRSHGTRWMLGNDLRGYILLGDPAVRLPATR